MEVGGRSPRDARVGLVVQQYSASLFPWRTAFDNVAFPLEIRGIPRRERLQRVTELLDLLRIKVPIHSYPYQLSGGQQQLLSIARSLSHRPDVLVLDEPFASLDYQTRIGMRMELTEIWAAMPLTVVLVSHEIDEALFLADRFVLLSKRPARILLTQRVDLARPRQQSQLHSPAFSQLRNAVLARFLQEVAA